MINNVASTRLSAQDIADLRESRAKKTEPAKDTAVETGEAQKPSHPAQPHGHVPPGLQRAAEKIASKIFARADADASGTVTLQELSLVHSKHARTLAASELFQTTTVEAAADSATAATIETGTDATAGTTEPAAEVPAETTPETPIQAGITEAQLKEALTKSFYAKVGVIYAAPVQPAIEPAPNAPADTTTPTEADSVPDETASDQGFAAVA
jgi:hypothetical protein